MSHRVFIAPVDGPGAGRPVDDATLLRFADDILAGDYLDRTYGPRPGDGGPSARFELERPS
jgi:hypothetical protein